MFKSKGSSSDNEKWIATDGDDVKPGDGKSSISKSLFKSKASSGNPYEVWTPPVQQKANSPAVVDIKTSDVKPGISRSKVPPPITVPPSVPITERKSPNHKVFTPFRYLNTKRNRTVSAASVEAVDGTAVSLPNTVVGSPTASMNSSQPPILPPPVRDTQQATYEWRERKESETRNNRSRVLRPGVVFDVPQDPHQDKQNLRYVKTSRSTRPSNA
ncbi:hypothetical protein BDP27DRAFT_1221861 [Rhodocollybia butyracea]|uniref:Uncharacterized protein n=1 Tax=Rhodocollybia butyracea TaxID=206335 RepID=A0A9P5PXH7_9AGAR|nr:hypothetical protein BDP27DRAFT_1221861 [Rhodocollybia butyracea]